ncbi:MAG: TlpA family protein disulfide reductase [Phenylobacterium sp.]|uniref:TlpA family protein disulfide reductase n=1 Tax=Phenylobacterium sp. TaxID=1871053 RepID=UPI0025E87AF8|nr:TlpA disulfide reductase family protein [Phenylobacterium sp.]MCA6227463.1 TlpA family protein disulfide reductase [Phenylobacterium sp.]MCA6230847.1 TlpA family protein disulfide reductase [Phenylobacterium sp.]MCA6235883.1 TlpA family protein disulfide reductase [Phenylobacterium sp.]MCA6248684.1 TlpA family protein disulfide reductase [Phenylobacterium sp.]MCA6252051.1 TlpA family protein disulfide reductase [Phenylobacterium sp.]
MSQDKEAGSPRISLLKLALWGAALVGAAGVLYIIAQSSITPRAKGGLDDLTRGEMSRLILPAEAMPAPVNSFQDASGDPVRIGDFRGKVVVVNLWATWCAPCILEMPTLARLAEARKDRDVVVLAVSIDREKDGEKARAFIAKNGPLEFYWDPKASLPFALKPPTAAMPTTLIYGRDGVERARMLGEADWGGKDALAVIDRLLEEE